MSHERSLSPVSARQWVHRAHLTVQFTTTTVVNDRWTKNNIGTCIIYVEKNLSFTRIRVGDERTDDDDDDDISTCIRTYICINSCIRIVVALFVCSVTIYTLALPKTWKAIHHRGKTHNARSTFSLRTLRYLYVEYTMFP